jgi:hypothetical protein
MFNFIRTTMREKKNQFITTEHKKYLEFEVI